MFVARSQIGRSQIGLMGKRLVSGLLILAVCLCLSGTPAIAADSPQTVIQTGTDQILQLLRQYPQDTAARRQQVQAVVNKYFDFEAMTRLAIGRGWNSLSPARQQEFTQEFTKLLFASYIGDLEKYARERISYGNRPVTQGYVVVQALIHDPNGPISLDYYLHLRDGNWKVYDVAVEGTSLVLNYRNQFESILANGSFHDLSMMLRQRIAQLCASGRC
jgi:phospholipid transport system substrate-binding protein